MTEAEARQWVLDEMEADQSELDDDELRAAGLALIDNTPAAQIKTTRVRRMVDELREWRDYCTRIRPVRRPR